jgi:hypothetical protein
MKITNKTSWRIAGVLFCIAALISCIFGYINHEIGTQVPIGMMWLCIGMASFTFGLKNAKKTKRGKSKI